MLNLVMYNVIRRLERVKFRNSDCVLCIKKKVNRLLLKAIHFVPNPWKSLSSLMGGGNMYSVLTSLSSDKGYYTSKALEHIPLYFKLYLLEHS